MKDNQPEPLPRYALERLIRVASFAQATIVMDDPDACRESQALARAVIVGEAKAVGALAYAADHAGGDNLADTIARVWPIVARSLYHQEPTPAPEKSPTDRYQGYEAPAEPERER